MSDLGNKMREVIDGATAQAGINRLGNERQRTTASLLLFGNLFPLQAAAICLAAIFVVVGEALKLTLMRHGPDALTGRITTVLFVAALIFWGWRASRLAQQTGHLGRKILAGIAWGACLLFILSTFYFEQLRAQGIVGDNPTITAQRNIAMAQAAIASARSEARAQGYTLDEMQRWHIAQAEQIIRTSTADLAYANAVKEGAQVPVPYPPGANASFDVHANAAAVGAAVAKREAQGFAVPAITAPWWVPDPNVIAEQAHQAASELALAKADLAGCPRGAEPNYPPPMTPARVQICELFYGRAVANLGAQVRVFTETQAVQAKAIASIPPQP